MEKKIKKIILTGGGTGGSISPLLAIFEELRGQGYEFLFIGGKRGPEKEMAEKEGIGFKAICSGKLRRYFDWHNFTDMFKVKAGFYQTLFIMLRWKPDLIITAGSFVSVPVVWAGWVLRKKIIVHQQDVRPGLANKIMFWFADVITVTFEKSLGDYGKKAVWTGNPTRQLRIMNHESRIMDSFKKRNDLPTIFITGGGTGAMAINELVHESVEELTKFCNVIHQTGKGKMQNTKSQISNYKSFEFLNTEEMAAAYAAADIVISRCGMGALTELSARGLPAILIPMPDSHQEENAAMFTEKQAALVLNQRGLTAEKFIASIKKLLENKEEKETLGKNIKTVMKKNANIEFAQVINNLK